MNKKIVQKCQQARLNLCLSVLSFVLTLHFIPFMHQGEGFTLTFCLFTLSFYFCVSYILNFDF